MQRKEYEEEEGDFSWPGTRVRFAANASVLPPPSAAAARAARLARATLAQRRAAAGDREASTMAGSVGLASDSSYDCILCIIFRKVAALTHYKWVAHTGQRYMTTSQLRCCLRWGHELLAACLCCQLRQLGEGRVVDVDPGLPHRGGCRG